DHERGAQLRSRTHLEVLASTCAPARPLAARARRARTRITQENGMTGSGTAILGGGALGLTLAYPLAQGGARVVAMERAPLGGGLAAGFPVGASGVWLEKFYHHLFRTDTTILALIRELGLEQKLYWGHPNTSSFIGGRPYRLDGVGPVLTFAKLPLWDRLRLGAGVAALKVLPPPPLLEGSTASHWLSPWMGSRVYRVVWEPLLRGKFGPHAESIGMPWMWARLHCRTSALGYLHGGFQQLYEALVEGIRTHGGEVRLGTDVRLVRPRAADTLQVVS